VRALARSLYADVKGRWTVREAIAFANLAVRRRETETKWVGFFLLARFAADLPADLAATIEGWIKGGLCANWALIDALSAEVIAPLIRNHPALLPQVTAWHQSKNQWLRRAALVPLVPFARRGEHLTATYSVVAALLSDGEDLTHKASGWLLREAGKTNPRRLTAFLMSHGPAIPRTTLRYAIERFPAAERARLLAETRGERQPVVHG
jgi:3-methyladenine DNA glycosylase AlkD